MPCPDQLSGWRLIHSDVWGFDPWPDHSQVPLQELPLTKDSCLTEVNLIPCHHPWGQGGGGAQIQWLAAREGSKVWLLCLNLGQFWKVIPAAGLHLGSGEASSLTILITSLQFGITVHRFSVCSYPNLFPHSLQVSQQHPSTNLPTANLHLRVRFWDNI